MCENLEKKRKHCAPTQLGQFLPTSVHDENTTSLHLNERQTKYLIVSEFCEIDRLAKETSQNIKVKSGILYTNRVKLAKKRENVPIEGDYCRILKQKDLFHSFNRFC